MTTITEPHASVRGAGMTNDEKFVIFASSLGTIFEWYDFYLYAVLAPFFAALFFPSGNDTAALLSAFATYAAGFLVRPFGALLFGRIGDLVGRKYTFLVTIMVMGASTFLVGLLPTFAPHYFPLLGEVGIGWTAPILLVTLRLLQGLALGGEYGGAATYVAEHARPTSRGFSTSWIQTTATLGLLMALIVHRRLPLSYMDTKHVRGVGLAHSVPGLGHPAGLLGLHPAQAQRDADLPEDEGRGQGLEGAADRELLPLPEQQVSCLLALLGATAGQGVVWYTRPVLRPVLPHHHAQAQLRPRLCADRASRSSSARRFFILFGWLSDRIGRLKIILAGCAIAAVTYFFLFAQLTHYVNPALEAFAAEESDHGSRRRLDLPGAHLRHRVHEVQQLRPRQDLRDQAWPVVQRPRTCRTRATRST